MIFSIKFKTFKGFNLRVGTGEANEIQVKKADETVELLKVHKKVNNELKKSLPFNKYYRKAPVYFWIV